MTNRLVWDAKTDTNGTSMQTYLPEGINLDTLERAAGYKATGSQAYYEPERGYDGWELLGTFDGVPFTIYTRWNVARIGGSANLDIKGLVAELEAITV